jgi:hypothetical protein
MHLPQTFGHMSKQTQMVKNYWPKQSNDKLKFFLKNKTTTGKSFLMATNTFIAQSFHITSI